MMAALNYRVGWVFGGICISAIVFTFLFLPETAGYKLEDIDWIFASSTPIYPFHERDLSHRLEVADDGCMVMSGIK